jgi:hypothetical protein
MRLLAAIVLVLGCASDGEPVTPKPMPSAGSSAGGAAGMAGGGTLGGAGSGGAAGGPISSSGAPAAGGTVGGSGGGKPVDACPEVKACTEKCTLMKPGDVLPGNHCAVGSFSCGDTLGYYASDGTEWTFTSATATEVTNAALKHCADG